MDRMVITLQAQAGPDYLGKLAKLAGQGAPVLCAPQPPAVATAQHLYPDRRIEVKTLYGEPQLDPHRPLYRLLGLWGWMLAPGPQDEASEMVRRRVIDTNIRLIQVAKEHGEATLVAGPLFLRLIAVKLNAIGYRGPLLSAPKAGESRVYEYQV